MRILDAEALNRTSITKETKIRRQEGSKRRGRAGKPTKRIARVLLAYPILYSDDIVLTR